MLIFELTPDQSEKFEAIKWLTDPMGHRGQGRTELLALAYVQHAINYRTCVDVTNHGMDNEQNRKELLERCASVVHRIGGYTMKISGRQGRTPKIIVEPIPDQEYKTQPFLTGTWKTSKGDINVG